MINTLKHRALFVTAMFMVAAPAFAQAPTEAQRSAIRSACRADYEAHCASIPPGGEASLQCLEKNISSLSSSCQSAVRAVEPAAAAPKAESAPAAKPGKPAAATAAPAAPKAAAGPAAAPTAALVLRPMRPREELFVLRSACSVDVRALCGGVKPGGGRIMQCLSVRAALISPACREVLAPFAAQ